MAEQEKTGANEEAQPLTESELAEYDSFVSGLSSGLESYEQEGAPEVTAEDALLTESMLADAGPEPEPETTSPFEDDTTSQRGGLFRGRGRRPDPGPAPTGFQSRGGREQGTYQMAVEENAIDNIGRYRQVVRWDSGPDDPGMSGLGTDAGTLYRHYYDPARGRPILYRTAYIQPESARAQSPFRMDEAVEIEPGTEEYIQAMEGINAAYGIEGE